MATRRAKSRKSKSTKAKRPTRKLRKRKVTRTSKRTRKRKGKRDIKHTVRRKRTTLRKSPKPRRKARPQRYNRLLEFALKHVREGGTLAEAATKIGNSPAQVRKYILGTGVAMVRKGKFIFKRDRRFRRLPLYSDGRRMVVTVHGLKTAQRVGAYMSAVKQFLETGDTAFLSPFEGQSIKDTAGKRYVYETQPNVLYRLDASAVEPFDIVYDIVKPE